GGRDPRSRDGPDLDPGVAHRASRFHDAAYERRAGSGDTFDRYGRRAVSHLFDARSGARPTTTPEYLSPMPQRVSAQRNDAGATRPGPARHWRKEFLLRQRLRRVQSDRLQGTQRYLRVDEDHRPAPRIDQRT